MHRLSMTSWLAEADGIPAEVQHLFDLSEYAAQAAEIEERVYGQARAMIAAHPTIGEG